MPHTPAVYVWYDIGVSNLVSLVRNLWYGAILSFQVMSPNILRFDWLILFDVNTIVFKTFNADFMILKISLSTSLHLPLACWYLWGCNVFWLSYFGSGYIFWFGAHIHMSSNTDTYAGLHISSDRVRSLIQIPKSVYAYLWAEFSTLNNSITFVRLVQDIHLLSVAS